MKYDNLCELMVEVVRSGEKWSDSRCILKIDPRGFADGLKMGYEKKRGVKDNAKGLCLSY